MKSLSAKQLSALKSASRSNVQESSVSSYFEKLGVSLVQIKEPRAIQMLVSDPYKMERVYELYNELLPVYSSMGPLQTETSNGVTKVTITLEG